MSSSLLRCSKLRSLKSRSASSFAMISFQIWRDNFHRDELTFGNSIDRINFYHLWSSYSDQLAESGSFRHAQVRASTLRTYQDNLVQCLINKMFSFCKPFAWSWIKNERNKRKVGSRGVLPQLQRVLLIKSNNDCITSNSSEQLPNF